MRNSFSRLEQTAFEMLDWLHRTLLHLVFFHKEDKANPAGSQYQGALKRQTKQIAKSCNRYIGGRKGSQNPNCAAPRR